MKIITSGIKTMTDEAGNLILCLVVPADRPGDRQAALTALAEIKGSEKIEIEAKPYKSRRSLEQNRMLWALLGKIAYAVSGYTRRTDVDDVYCDLLAEANVKCEYLLALPEALPALRGAYRAVQSVGERVVGEKTLTVFRCYPGSSKFNVSEMNALIDLALDRCGDLGIDDPDIWWIREEQSNYKKEKGVKEHEFQSQ